MEQSEQIILWDFEGTLVNRPGLWRSALMEVLDVNEPDHQVDMEQIRPYLRDAFPWLSREPFVRGYRVGCGCQYQNRSFQG